MSLDAPRTPAPSTAVLFLDVHSGRGARFDSFDDVRALVACVAGRVEREMAGRRFPLLHVVERRRPLSGTECEALVWELARLRTILSTLPAVARDDDGAGAPTAGLGSATGVAGHRTLADVHQSTILALDHAARLGAASRRGARFEADDAAPGGGAVAARRFAEGR